MARAANTYRAARRAAGKLQHRQNRAGVGKNMPSVSLSPVPFKLGYQLPSRHHPRNKKPFNLQAGNVPGSVRRRMARQSEALAEMVRLDQVLGLD